MCGTKKGKRLDKRRAARYFLLLCCLRFKRKVVSRGQGLHATTMLGMIPNGRCGMRLPSTHCGIEYPHSHKLTTRVSSLRNSRRYRAISSAIPFGSLTFFERSSLSTLRRPSFHLCLSSDVLPGFAVPSWRSSLSPV